MRKALSWLLIPLLALLVTACGGGSTTTVQPPARTRQAVSSVTGSHACSPADAVMQCFLAQPPPTPPAATHAVAYGVDFAWGGPSCATLHSEGKSFGASYLSTDLAKNWQHAQFSDYTQHGCKVVFVWETSSLRATEGSAAGRDDARAALSQYRSYIPHGRVVIYFAIDCDCSGASVWSYFDGVKSVLGVGSTGAYGGVNPITSLCATHRISYAWSTYAWSGSAVASCTSVYQYLNDSSVDYDRALKADYGQYPPPSAPRPKPRLVCWGKHSTPHVSACRSIEQQATKLWKGHKEFAQALARQQHEAGVVQGRIVSLQKNSTSVHVSAYSGPGLGFLSKRVAVDRYWSDHDQKAQRALVTKYRGT